MPNWNDIHKEISTTPNAYDLVRRKYIRRFSEYTKRNTIIYYSGWLNHDDPNTAIGDEDVAGIMNAIHELDRDIGLNLVLHTQGGNYHATMNLIRYLREMFGENIDTYVPQMAMSGGTIMACMGRKIFMGKHSNLGPIDPHIGNASAANVKEEFDRIVNGEWPEIVATNFLSKYPPSFLNEVEKLLQLSRDEFTELLRGGMFKADISSAEQTIQHIVDSLSDPRITKAHNRHISKESCKQLGLKIEDLEADENLQDCVLSIHHSCMLAFSSGNGVLKIIENQSGKAFIKNTQIAVKPMPIIA